MRKVIFDTIFSREQFDSTSYKESVIQLGTYIHQVVENTNKEFNKITIVCIGTDKAMYDSLGPLVGTYLEEMNLHYVVKLMGSLDGNVHAKNLEEEVKDINYENNLVIAIDASASYSVEDFKQVIIKDVALKPGKGAGKILPSVGDVFIYGITNIISTSSPLRAEAKLSEIISMSKLISDGIKYYIGTYFISKVLKEYLIKS